MRFDAWSPIAALTAALLFATPAYEPRSGPPPPATPEPALSALQPFPCPAAPGSVAPSLATSPDGVVWLSWLEPRKAGGHALRASRLEGDGWRSPVTIAEGDSFFVNRSDIPVLLPRRAGHLVAAFLWKSGSDPGAHEVRLTQSRDNGATWSRPQVAHRDGTPTEHGFVSLIEAGEGTRAVWLDGRKAARGSPGHWTAAPEGLYETTLRTAVMGASQGIGDEGEVDGRVCDCCQTAAVTTPRGTLVAYRGRSADEVRDIWITRLEAGRWGSPTRLHADDWKIAGCPVNGPSLASDGSRVAAAWYTNARDTAKVQVALSYDGGVRFGPPVRVDGGHPLGRASVRLIAGDDALVCWLEGEGTDTRFQVRRIGRAGPVGTPITVAQVTARGSGLPRMVVNGNRVVLAWTEPGPTPGVRTALGNVTVAASLNDAR